MEFYEDSWGVWVLLGIGWVLLEFDGRVFLQIKAINEKIQKFKNVSRIISHAYFDSNGKVVGGLSTYEISL